MNCRDFERLCNERLDARDVPRPGLGGDLETHAAACPRCRALASQYQTLASAIRALSQARPSPVPAGFANRVLAAVDVDTAARFRLRALCQRTRAISLASAAALVLAVTLGLRAWGPGLGREQVAGNPSSVIVASNDADPTDPRDLASALADATSATLSLAREASAPAARVGSEVIGNAGFPDSPPRFAGLPVPVVKSAEVWRGVGDRVNAGVVPLSSSARSAFGFLIGTPVSNNADRPTPRRTPRGA